MLAHTISFPFTYSFFFDNDSDYCFLFPSFTIARYSVKGK